MVVSTNGGSPNHAFLSRIFHQKTIQLMGYLHDFGNLVICMYQWFGLSEILQETIDVPIRELGFSCKLARKPIHWLKPLPIAYGTIDNDSCFCRLIAELKPKMARETQKPCSKRKCHFITGEERDSQNRLWYNMIVPNELGSTTPYIYKYIYIYYITYNHQGTIPLNTVHMDLKTSMVAAWLPRGRGAVASRRAARNHLSTGYESIGFCQWGSNEQKQKFHGDLIGIAWDI